MELNPCPFCGEIPILRGGPEEWSPTYYDPDSGGDPYHVVCSCGVQMNIGYCEASEIVEKWNTRIKEFQSKE